MSDLATSQPMTVTPSAARRIAALAGSDADPGKRLRVSVSGGGCSGFQYGFALDAAEEEGDILIPAGETAVVVDGTSLLYLMGAELDFVEDLTGSYFRMSNPNASSSCGCGSSFSI